MNRNELKKLKKKSKSQLLELLIQEKKKKKKPAPIRKVIPKGPQISTIIQRPVPAPRTKKSKISTIIQRPVPTPRTKKPKISTKKSYILDEPIPEKEIPKGQKILQPSIINNIKNVVKWGKKQVENWGDWLMKGVKWGKKQVENLGENLGNWFMNLKAPEPEETEDDEVFKTAPEETAPEETEDDEVFKTAPEETEADETKAPKITQLAQALQDYTKSYEISIINNKDPLLQLQNTRIALESHISSLLTSMNGLKFLEALKVTLSKISDGETISDTVYFFSTPQTIINNIEIKASLEATQEKILNKIAIWISEGSGWTIESVDNHYLNVVTFQPLTGSSYIKLPQELRNSKKGLINLQNEDNECFRWCHIRHLNPQKKKSTNNKKRRWRIY